MSTAETFYTKTGITYDDLETMAEGNNFHLFGDGHYPNHPGYYYCKNKYPNAYLKILYYDDGIQSRRKMGWYNAPADDNAFDVCSTDAEMTECGYLYWREA